MANFVMIEEGFRSDASLDLDGKLREENYGKNVNENYCVEDLCRPINSQE